MQAPIVTLTTDWGDKDYFIAMVKGKLYSMVPEARVVDLSHHQIWNDMVPTVGIVRYGCLSFPTGTVHIIDVGVEQQHFAVQNVTGPVLVSYRGHYFICSERRVLEQAFDNPCDEIVELKPPADGSSCSFLASTLFCEVAARLLSGTAVASLGSPCEPLRRRSFLLAQVDGDILNAMVIGIDSYGNANLNVRYEDFEAVRAGRRFRIELEWRAGVGERLETITGVSRHYSDVRVGDLLLIVSTTGLLQLAINKGSVTQLIGLKYASRCRFIFAPRSV